MPAAVKLREDFSAQEPRALARRAKDVNQSRRLLSLAAVRDGKDRAEAAQIGGMDRDRQALRAWVHRFNARGPEGPFDHWTEGPKPRLSAEQLAELATIVGAGPDSNDDETDTERSNNLTRFLGPSPTAWSLLRRGVELQQLRRDSLHTLISRVDGRLMAAPDPPIAAPLFLSLLRD